MIYVNVIDFFKFNFSFTACYTRSVLNAEGMPATGADTQMWKKMYNVLVDHIWLKLLGVGSLEHWKQGQRIWNVQALSESNLLEKWVQKWWSAVKMNKFGVIEKQFWCDAPIEGIVNVCLSVTIRSDLTQTLGVISKDESDCELDMFRQVVNKNDK